MKNSACIVTYNSVRTDEKKQEITTAVSSLLKYSKGEFQLFIVDNASQDGTAQYLKNTFGESITVIENKENCGFGEAHNKVLDLIESDYHFIINPDIEIKTDVISILAEFMNNNKNVGMVNPQVNYPDGTLQPLAKRQPTLRYIFANHFAKDRLIDKTVREYCMVDECKDKPFEVYNATGCFMGIRTDAFKRLNGFDKRFFMYFEDFDLARRVNKDYEIYCLPGAVVYHAWERGSGKNFKLLLTHICSMIKYFTKWIFHRGVK